MTFLALDSTPQPLTPWRPPTARATVAINHVSCNRISPSAWVNLCAEDAVTSVPNYRRIGAIKALAESFVIAVFTTFLTWLVMWTIGWEESVIAIGTLIINFLVDFGSVLAWQGVKHAIKHSWVGHQLRREALATNPEITRLTAQYAHQNLQACAQLKAMKVP